MTIAPELLREFPAVNKAQRDVVGHDEGPLLVIAGSGSGRTYPPVLRAPNPLLLGKASPSELTLCTFTEKAAFEPPDRLASAARQLGYAEDLTELRVGCDTMEGLIPDPDAAEVGPARAAMGASA